MGTIYKINKRMDMALKDLPPYQVSENIDVLRLNPFEAHLCVARFPLVDDRMLSNRISNWTSVTLNE